MILFYLTLCYRVSIVFYVLPSFSVIFLVVSCFIWAFSFFLIVTSFYRIVKWLGFSQSFLRVLFLPSCTEFNQDSANFTDIYRVLLILTGC